MPEPTRDQRLRTALADEHRHLYATSAAFRTSVDTLAAMLPAMVNGLAEQAEVADARRDALIEASMSAAASMPTRLADGLAALRLTPPTPASDRETSA